MWTELPKLEVCFLQDLDNVRAKVIHRLIIGSIKHQEKVKNRHNTFSSPRRHFQIDQIDGFLKIDLNDLLMVSKLLPIHLSDNQLIDYSTKQISINYR